MQYRIARRSPVHVVTSRVVGGMDIVPPLFISFVLSATEKP